MFSEPAKSAHAHAAGRRVADTHCHIDGLIQPILGPAGECGEPMRAGSPMRSRRRATRLVWRIVFVPLAGATAFLLACAVAEIVTYARNPAAYGRRASARNDSKDTIFDAFLGTCFTDSDYLPFALAPGRYTLPGGQRVTINSRGYRGGEFAVPKPPTTIRLLFLGDSFTYGYGADDESTIPRLVEKMLQDRCADVEAINAGFHGSNPMQYELYLHREGFALTPDCIVLVVYPGNDLNDVYYNFVEERDDRGQPSRIADGLVCHAGRRFHSLLPGWLYHAPILDRSVLWHHLNRRAYASLRRWQQRGITREHSWEFFRQPMLQMVEESRRRGIELSVWVIAGRETVDPRSCPWLREDEQIEAEAEARRFVLDSLRQTGVDYIDLAPALAAACGDEVCLPRDGHLNARGNTLVAAAGASRLLTTAPALVSGPTDQSAAQLTAQMPLRNGDSEPSR